MSKHRELGGENSVGAAGMLKEFLPLSRTLLVDEIIHIVNRQSCQNQQQLTNWKTFLIGSNDQSGYKQSRWAIDLDLLQ